MFLRCVVVCSSGVDIACSGVVGMAKQGMSLGDFEGGQFSGSRPLSPWERARILPREGFEAKIRALGFLVLGNLGYSLC